MLIFSPAIIFGQRAKDLLIKADSLYIKSKFGAALPLYQTIIKQHKSYSPQMLLKMAAITEPARDITSTLYYLNLYYVQNPNPTVKHKILELAERYELKGYDLTEVDYLLFLYFHYYHYILASLSGFSLILLFGMIRRRYLQKPLVYYPLFFIVSITLSIALVNLSNLYRRGIISGKRVYLMEGPASGAPLLGVIGQGHKVLIKERADMWYRIDWDGKDAYINQNNLLVLEN